MRKNLSEELEINDVVTLNDGSEEKPEEEKEEDKLKKEVQKELDDKNKIADEVKEAEAPKVEANNGLGKSTKIKQFVEKLTLEEPDNSLNEDLEDQMFEKRQESVHAIFDAISNYGFELKVNQGKDNQYIEDELYSICEEAIVRFLDDEAK